MATVTVTVESPPGDPIYGAPVFLNDVAVDERRIFNSPELTNRDGVAVIEDVDQKEYDLRVGNYPAGNVTVGSSNVSFDFGPGIGVFPGFVSVSAFDTVSNEKIQDLPVTIIGVSEQEVGSSDVRATKSLTNRKGITYPLWDQNQTRDITVVAGSGDDRYYTKSRDLTITGPPSDDTSFEMTPKDTYSSY